MNKKESQNGIFSDKWNNKFFENLCTVKGSSCTREGLQEAIIFFVLKGSLLITVENYENRIVNCGEAALIPHGGKYTAQAIEDLHLISCNFKTDALIAANAPLEEIKSLVKTIEYDFHSIKINDILFKYLNLLEEYFLIGDLNFSIIEIKKIELFHILFTCYTKHEIANFLYPILGEDIGFKEFVINNYLNVKSVPELANLAHYSLSGFEKKFRRCFNESPYSWILHNKAEIIRKELEMGTSTFQEIAYKYNFSSYRSFLRFCQTQLGLSPSQISLQKH